MLLEKKNNLWYKVCMGLVGVVRSGKEKGLYGGR